MKKFYYSPETKEVTVKLADDVSFVIQNVSPEEAKFEIIEGLKTPIQPELNVNPVPEDAPAPRSNYSINTALLGGGAPVVEPEKTVVPNTPVSPVTVTTPAPTTTTPTVPPTTTTPSPANSETTEEYVYTFGKFKGKSISTTLREDATSAFSYFGYILYKGWLKNDESKFIASLKTVLKTYLANNKVSEAQLPDCAYTLLYCLKEDLRTEFLKKLGFASLKELYEGRKSANMAELEFAVNAIPNLL